MNLTKTPQLDASCECQPESAGEAAGIADQARAVAAEIAYEMAYGLSHELNNPLANIAGRARLLAERETDPEKRQQLAIIVDQAMRGCEMIADLMLFARPPAWSPGDVDLRSLLKDVCDRAEKSNSRAVTIALDVDQVPSCAMITADREGVSEAVWAVLRNALEVARASIEVRLSQQERCFHVTISDDGPGLSQLALERAFHPYFSGREAGRGIGLGLSKAQRIVALCGGHIWLENIVPTGCCVHIRVPVRNGTTQS